MRRHSYTLIELIIVVAIMVIAAGIAVPIIRSVLSDTRQSSSGDAVRAQLAETRARAMDEGRPWRLAYLPGTGFYQYAPEDADWSQVQTYPDLKVDLVRDSLPEGIIFGATQQEILNGGGAAGSKWITIAVYLPAGNARPPEDPTMDAGRCPRGDRRQW